MTDKETTNNPLKQAALNEIVTRIMYCLTTDDFGFGGNDREDRIIFDTHQILTRWNNAAHNKDIISERDLSNALTYEITLRIAKANNIMVNSEEDIKRTYRKYQWRHYNHVSGAVRCVFKGRK